MKPIVRYSIVAAVDVVVTVCLITVGFCCGKEKQFKKDTIIQMEYVRQIDSLSQIIQDVYSTSVDYSRKCDSLNSRLEALSSESQNLKKKYEEKINSVTFFTDDELQSFFTDRYTK